MNRKPKNLPTQYRQNRSCTAPITIPNVNPSFNGKALNYMRFGKNGDRTVLGRITRTITVKNARNETLRMREEHEFANGSQGEPMAIVHHRRGNGMYHRRRPNGSHR